MQTLTLNSLKSSFLIIHFLFHSLLVSQVNLNSLVLFLSPLFIHSQVVNLGVVVIGRV